VATRSKACVCGCSLAGVGVPIPPGAHGCLSLVIVVCCQIEVSAKSWSLVQSSPTECGISECDLEASIMRRTWPTRGCCDKKKRNRPILLFFPCRVLGCTIEITT
jgi:hypothetical protein